MTAFRAERGRRRVGCASLAIVATVALLAGGVSAASARISNDRDSEKSAPRICRQFAGDTQATANCLLAQPLPDIDRLYATLHAGPMPGWRKPGHGTFRCVWLEGCGSQASVQLLNTVVPLVWGGKTFFTHKKGGWLWNRPAPLENGLVSGPVDGNTGVLIGNVQYGPSYLDGNRAVTITYQGLPDAPISVGGVKVVSGAPDDCRTFERKLWLCNAWYDFRPASAPQRWAVFTLDFTKKGA
ncbi:MAG TPA: hypothetical protein VHU24_09920 [Solirubrobacterales bacterium]|jgi:hypothetical protein|nr:hypothetical protein [Solirubrobacterales bacterium]